MACYISKPETMRWVICGGHKDRAYVNNTHCLKELNDNIQL